MPSSAVHAFTDPDAYHAKIRRTQVVQGVVTTRGRSELTRTDLHRLWMQRGNENLARVLNFAPAGERVPILFATDQRQAAMYFSGLELSPDEIIVIGFGAASHHRSSAACRWGAISLTLEDLVAAGHRPRQRCAIRPTTPDRKKIPLRPGNFRNLHSEPRPGGPTLASAHLGSASWPYRTAGLIRLVCREADAGKRHKHVHRPR
jgi:hypothetical protein